MCTAWPLFTAANLDPSLRRRPQSSIAASMASIVVGSRVWRRSTSQSDGPPFALAEVVALTATEATVRYLEPVSEEIVELPELLPANTGEPVDNNSMLTHLSPATLLDNLLRRYETQLPYTFTGSILTSASRAAARSRSGRLTMLALARARRSTRASGCRAWSRPTSCCGTWGCAWPAAPTACRRTPTPSPRRRTG